MNIYQTLYDLVNTYIFGNTLVAGTYPDLAAILVSMIGTLFTFAIPFIIVYRIIKFITGR